MPTAPAIMSPRGSSNRVFGFSATPMLQVSKVVPSITAITAGPSIRHSVKVLPSITVWPAFT
ncbi:hypothetical protein D3C75_1098590 [compost metagenome]